jgi:hypothetical protein
LCMYVSKYFYVLLRPVRQEHDRQA